MDPSSLIWLIIILLAVIAIMLWLRIKPTNEANWSLDQKVLAHAEIKENCVTVYNIRNFHYNSEKDYVPRYYDKTFDLNKIKSVDFAFVPYSKLKFLAHTFLTFGFTDGSYVAVSVEVRKKVGQEFSVIKSLFKQYEIMFVVADENDVVKLRTNHRNEPVHLYPIKTSKKGVQKLFLNILKRVNDLKEKPEFYSLFTNTCTTNLTRQVNEIVPGGIPASYKIFLPGYSAQLAHELGIVDTELSFQEAHAKFYINEKAKNNHEPEGFSQRIRG